MKSLFKPGLHWLFVFIPVSFLINYVPALKNDVALFVCSCLSMVVLAGLISTATEHLAARVGSTVGGLLNASFSNLPEIIFGTVALYHGLTPLVKAAMTGAIIGNLLFVLGHSMFAGGLKNGVQRFSAERASDYSTGLYIAVMALFIPTIYHVMAEKSSGGWHLITSEDMSLWLAIMLFCAYLASLVYSLVSRARKDQGADPDGSQEDSQEDMELGTPWSLPRSAVVLGVASFLIAVISDYVAGSVQVVEKAFGLSELFMGVIVIAIIGNVSAQTTAVRMAMKNKMNLCLEVAVSASSQVALLVVPLLVFASFLFGHPMTLEFGIHEIVAVAAAVLLTSQICNDGKSNWLNGFQMLILYAIIAVLFYFSPA